MHEEPSQLLRTSASLCVSSKWVLRLLPDVLNALLFGMTRAAIADVFIFPGNETKEAIRCRTALLLIAIRMVTAYIFRTRMREAPAYIFTFPQFSKFGVETIDKG